MTPGDAIEAATSAVNEAFNWIGPPPGWSPDRPQRAHGNPAAMFHAAVSAAVSYILRDDRIEAEHALTGLSEEEHDAVRMAACVLLAVNEASRGGVA